MELAGQNLVQVPAAFLDSLLVSIQDLRRDFNDLKDEVERLKESSGTHFHRFSKLPREIRDTIWKFALTAPQTHITRRELVTRSQVNMIMRVCREARTQGLKLRLPYFACCYTQDHPDWVKNYVNLDVDTIWMTEAEIFLPETPRIFCPDCSAVILHEWAFGRHERTCTHSFRPNRLVMNFDNWTDPDEARRDVPEISSHEIAGSADILTMMNGLEELLLVVGDKNEIERVAKDGTARFVEPSEEPAELLPNFDFENNMPEHLFLSDLGMHSGDLRASWGSMVERLENILAHYKGCRAEVRSAHIENGMTEDEIDLLQDCLDLSDWKIPRVRYVEVVSESTTKKWSRPIPARYILTERLEEFDN